MGTVADRAIRLDGVSRSQLVCNEFVNEVLYHTKYGRTAKDYLTWGVPAYGFAEGVVIVKRDGSHVGIFVNDHEFMHSSSNAHKVIKRGISQINWAFGHDYLLRKER